MAKYLYHASYTVEGVRGLLKEGGSSRREAISEMTEALGGTMEALYFAFGEDDVYLIVDVPDQVTAAASLAIAANGAVNIRTTVLLTTEEIDAAARKTVSYRPPGR